MCQSVTKGPFTLKERFAYKIVKKGPWLLGWKRKKGQSRTTLPGVYYLTHFRKDGWSVSARPLVSQHILPRINYRLTRFGYHVFCTKAGAEYYFRLESYGYSDSYEIIRVRIRGEAYRFAYHGFTGYAVQYWRPA